MSLNLKDRINSDRHHFVKWCLSLFISLILIGCSTFGVYNPATGRKEFVAISTSEEVSLGKSYHKGIAEQEGLSQDNAQIDRIQRIGQKVAEVSDRKDYDYHFYVVDKEDLNAFTSLGGNIYIYSGLIEKLETDDRIAAVLAHEVGHCAARHVAKKFQSSVGFGLAQSLVLAYLGVESRTREAVSLSSSVVMGLVSSAYSRKDEYAADKLAVKYVYNAGYSPNAVVEVLKVLAKEAKGSKGLLWLRSHPYLDDRIAIAKEEVAKIGQDFD